MIAMMTSSQSVLVFISAAVLGSCTGHSATRPVGSVASTKMSDYCSTGQRLADGGALLRSQDGVAIWFKLSGRKGAPTIAYLHGGPGYNSFAFEKSSGKLLESRFQVLYIDQRGCGRSGFQGTAEQYGMTRTVDDLEHIRLHVGVERLILVGHSFGGVVAAEYAHRFPSRVAAVVMVDTTPDLGRALQQQIAYIESIADKRFATQAMRVHAVAHSTGSPFEILSRIYGVLGRGPLQSELHYAVAQNQKEMEAIDEKSGIMSCTSSQVVAAFQKEGYLSKRLPSVARRITAPTLLVAGRSSHVVGEENIQIGADIWGAQIQWLEAGHFVYFEKPEEFVDRVKAFLRKAGIDE